MTGSHVRRDSLAPMTPKRSGTERNGTGSNCCTIRMWMLDTWPEICVNFALIRTVRFCVRTLIPCSVLNSYEDGTSTNREPRQAYKTAEVGYSQLWAQSWVMLAYVLLDRTGNGFHIKISVNYVESSKPALAQTQVSKMKHLSYL